MNDLPFMTEVTPPVLIKNGSTFLITRPDGGISPECGGGFGLFYRDTRYLSLYDLSIGGEPLLPLMTSSAPGDRATHELTNDKVAQTDGRDLDLQSVSLRLDRTIAADTPTLRDRVAIRNFTAGRVSFVFSLRIDALFEDLFELRGAEARARGAPRRVEIGETSVAFLYKGADGVARSLHAMFSRPIRVREKDGAQIVDFDFALENQAVAELTVEFRLAEEGVPTVADPPIPDYFQNVVLCTDDPGLDRAFSRSLCDLRMLRTSLETNFIAGGLPWFVSPFGRDSLMAALQTLAFDPRPAEDVARLFARYQGAKTDAETGEQPGKIHHELRLGAMARLGEIPQRPSYMSVDATPLFLILVAEHARWARDRTLLRDLRPAIDAALAWIDGPGDSDGDGYLDYRGEAADGPINQGWKDSTSGIPRKDGGVPKSPIALCEAQAYVYLAKTLVAEVLRSEGETAIAERLDREAAELRARFNRDFWMEDEGCFALALEAGGRPLTVVASNAGHALWSGIADPDKAAQTRDRLMRPDMNSGWGIRTLSERETAYNPLNYHLGSVWPFDNAMIVRGFRRYGFDDAALEIFEDVLDASRCFAMGRLPEFYVGLAREPGLVPARCPFAEPLQAWSAGATPDMLASLLGLESAGGELRARRPILPKSMRRLELTGLGVDSGMVDCAFERSACGTLEARIGPAREVAE